MAYRINKEANVSSWDIRETEKAGKALTMHAVTLSSRFLTNGILKCQFIREVDRYEQHLVNDFKSGRKCKQVVFKELRKERHNLTEQGTLITQKGVPIIAHVMRMMPRAGMSYESATSMCFIGTQLINHGMSVIQGNEEKFFDENIHSKEMFQSHLNTMLWTQTEKAKYFKLFRYCSEEYLGRL